MMAPHFRHDDSDPMAWCDWPGPHVVSAVDGTDLGIKDLKSCWYFIRFVRDGMGLEMDEFMDFVIKLVPIFGMVWLPTWAG